MGALGSVQEVGHSPQRCAQRDSDRKSSQKICAKNERIELRNTAVQATETPHILINQKASRIMDPGR